MNTLREYSDLRTVPKSELERALELMFARPEDYDVPALVAQYKSLGLKVIGDPTTDRVVRYARDALKHRRPHSAIRLGEGKLCVLTFGRFSDTPKLDRFVAYNTLLKQSDTFDIDDTWMIVIRELMLGGIASADIVGVAGLWREDGPTRGHHRSPDKLRERFLESPRGLYGDWKGRVYLPHLARLGYFDGKVVASNHFYLAFLAGLDSLVTHAAAVLLVTEHDGLEAAFNHHYPDKPLSTLRVGHRDDKRRMKAKEPFFLAEYEAALPRDLTGTLCLVGGGPWSLILCSWLKQRGGVAVDIGSGLDLLAGQMTRSTHRRIADQAAAFAMSHDHGADMTNAWEQPDPSPA